jgi:hypothetical protein
MSVRIFCLFSLHFCPIPAFLHVILPTVPWRRLGRGPNNSSWLLPPTVFLSLLNSDASAHAQEVGRRPLLPRASNGANNAFPQARPPRGGGLAVIPPRRRRRRAVLARWQRLRPPRRQRGRLRLRCVRRVYPVRIQLLAVCRRAEDWFVVCFGFGGNDGESSRSVQLREGGLQEDAGVGGGGRGGRQPHGHGHGGHLRVRRPRTPQAGARSAARQTWRGAGTAPRAR